MHLEEILNSIIGIFVLIFVLSSLTPLMESSDLFGFSSFFIGFSVFAVVLALILKVLDELGVKL